MDDRRAAPAEPPAQFADGATIARGKAVYHRHCGGCHGDAGISGSIYDLRTSTAAASAAAWATIVRDGALSARGMIGFASEVSAEEAEAVRAYVIERAHRTLQPRR